MIRIPLEYRRNFYCILRQMILDHGTTRAKLRFYWDLILFVNNCCFMVPALIMMASDYKFEWWHYEPISYYFYKNRAQYDHYLLGAIYMFDVFIFYMQYNYYRMPAHSPTWQWYYQLIAVLQDWHDQCVIKDQEKLKQIYTRKTFQIQQNTQSSKYSGFAPNVLIKKIPTLQQLIQGRGWILYKLKYDDLFTRLLFGPKYGTRIGPLKEVSNFVLSELVMIYVGYLLMIFSQEIESRMHQKEN